MRTPSSGEDRLGSVDRVIDDDLLVRSGPSADGHLGTTWSRSEEHDRDGDARSPHATPVPEVSWGTSENRCPSPS